MWELKDEADLNTKGWKIRICDLIATQMQRCWGSRTLLCSSASRRSNIRLHLQPCKQPWKVPGSCWASEVKRLKLDTLLSQSSLFVSCQLLPRLRLFRILHNKAINCPVYAPEIQRSRGCLCHTPPPHPPGCISARTEQVRAFTRTTQL